jgi:predicted TIM-barrel fold metal-dependent hydrolase
MYEPLKIIDAHAHILPKIDGIKRGEKTSSAKFGRIKWKNEELTFLPPYFKDTLFSADMLVETMNFAGVSKAVLLQNPVLGIINEEIRKAIEQYPEHFVGTVQVDPLQPDACKIIQEYASEKQNTLKLEISEEWGWSGTYDGFSLTGTEMMKIWETVAKNEMRVIIDPGDIFNKGYQVENIRLIAEQFPKTKILIEHLGFFRESIRFDAKALERRQQMLNLGKEFENVYFGFSSAAAFLNDDYPCSSALLLLQEAIKIMGVDKILWGSDIPSTFKKYTYQQLIDVIAVHASFLSASGKQQILHDNAESFFWSQQKL